MKTSYTTANGRLTFEFDCDSDKAIFSNLARIQEIFEESECGCCKSKSIRFEERHFEDFTYFKMVCTDCNATLDFGQHKNGETLFAKRFEKDDAEKRVSLPNRGWYRYSDRQQPTAAPTTANGQAPKPEQKTDSALAGKHKEILDAYAVITTAERLDQWNKHALGFRFTPQQAAEQSEARAKAIERIQRAAALRKPATAGARP